MGRLSLGLAFLSVVSLSSALTSYIVKLDFHPTFQNYHGWVQIIFTNTEENRDYLQLYTSNHPFEIKQSEVKLQGIGLGPRININSIEQKDGNLYLRFSETLIQNFNYSLEIPFEGYFLNIGEKGNGVKVDGDIIYSENTVTAESNANGAFPCFDDTSTFTLELKHMKNWKSYSFTSGSRTEYGGFAITKFDETKAIYPSSLSFVILGDYEEKKFDKDRGITFLYPKGNEPSVYLQRCADMSLSPFSAMTEDMGEVYIVSIPSLTHDSQSNLNMIYMKSSLLEYDPESTTDDNAELCLMTLKLIAQQFYGIRLAPKTDDESGQSPQRDNFISQAAPYFLAVQAFNNLGDFWGKDFIEEKTTEIFDMGFIEESILDDETGLKGAAFLTMLPDFHSETLEGLVQLMTSFYKNKTTIKQEPLSNVDFYNFLKDEWKGFESNLTYNGWKDWMEESKLLLLTITKDTNQYTIQCTEKLDVPVLYTRENGNGDPQLKLIHCNKNEKIEDVTEKWIFLNPKGTGLYRAKYPDDILDILKNHTEIRYTLQGRSRMISDSLELAVTTGDNKVCTTGDSYEKVLDLTNYLRNEYNCTPWKIAIKKLSILKNLIYSKYKPNDNQRGDLKNRMERMLKYITDHLGEEKSNSFVSSMFQKTILQANVMFNVKEIQMKLLQTYLKLNLNYTKPESIGGDILQAAKCAVLAIFGNEDYYWRRFEEEYNTNSNQIKKRRLFEIYACSNGQRRVVNKIIGMPDSDDQKFAFDNFTSNADNVGNTLQAMVEISKIEKKPEENVMRMMLQVIGPRLNGAKGEKATNTSLDDINENYNETLTQEVEEAKAGLQNILKFNQDCGGEVRKWLKSPLDPPNPPPPTPTGGTLPTEPTGMTSSNTAASTDGGGTTANPSSTTTEKDSSATSAALSTAAALVAAAAIFSRL